MEFLTSEMGCTRGPCAKATDLAYLWVGVNRSVELKVHILLHSLLSPRTLVAGSEHSEFKSGQSQLSEAANEADTVLPEAAFHAATTASLPLQHLLAGELVLCVSGHSDTSGSDLEDNFSGQEGNQLAGVAYRAAQGAESWMGWLEDHVCGGIGGSRVHLFSLKLEILSE